MQALGRDQSRAQQLQIVQDPGRRFRQHRKPGDLLRWQRVLGQRPERGDMAVVRGDEFEHGAAPHSEPYGERPAGKALGAQQQFSLGGPLTQSPEGVEADASLGRVRGERSVRRVTGGQAPTWNGSRPHRIARPVR